MPRFQAKIRRHHRVVEECIVEVEAADREAAYNAVYGRIDDGITNKTDDNLGTWNHVEKVTVNATVMKMDELPPTES